MKYLDVNETRRPRTQSIFAAGFPTKENILCTSIFWKATATFPAKPNRREGDRGSKGRECQASESAWKKQ